MVTNHLFDYSLNASYFMIPLGSIQRRVTLNLYRVPLLVLIAISQYQTPGFYSCLHTDPSVMTYKKSIRAAKLNVFLEFLEK